jgi:hypothetical protein
MFSGEQIDWKKITRLFGFFSRGATKVEGIEASEET